VIGGQPGHLEPLNVNDPFVLTETEFALEELRKLSDSTIYSTLELSQIMSAAKEDGIFHENTILELELSSPYFRSKKLFERFHVFVMTHKEDDVKSFAINEFPVMNEDAIEMFHIAKVERKKEEREQYFRLLEIESMSETVKNALGGNGSSALASANDFFDMIEMKDAAAALGISSVRRKCTEDIQQQLSGEYLEQEIQLARLSLRDIYEITLGKTNEATDFQLYRAQKMLDTVVAHLQSIP
jgi:hypothetical protein